MQTVKMVITGAFSAGKTEFIRTISEIDVVSTERRISSDAEKSQKEQTTVAMDFGRISLGDDLILYLFGTPGQDRFRFMWDDLVRGAIGAVVLVDTSRLEDCFSAVDYFESNAVPFIVAVNAFNGHLHPSLEAVRSALSIPDDVPVIRTDARDRGETKLALLELVQHALLRATA